MESAHGFFSERVSAHMRFVIRVAVVALALLAPTSQARASTIQPGDYVNVDDIGGCTLGWLFDSPTGDVYFASAAHCFTDGETVEIAGSSGPSVEEAGNPANGEVLGTVRVRGNDEFPESDVALILVREEMKARVAGDLRGHEGIPAGVATTGAANDALQLSGWGAGFELTPQTRESRQGVLTELKGSWWAGVIPAPGGDSGGPVAHIASKSALGLVKGHTCGFDSDEDAHCGSWGPSIQGILEVAQAAGISLTLRRAGQPAPVAAAPQPQPQPEPPPGQSPPASQPQRQQPQPAGQSEPSSRGSASKRTLAKRAACRRKAKKIKSTKRRKAALRRCSRLRAR
jgi:hypothetical protein